MNICRIFAIIGTSLTFLALQCSHDYNPFEDSSNAQAYFLLKSSSERVRNHDTLSIFSTETLSVYATVREKIDSITILTPGNRKDSVKVFHAPFATDSFIVLLSYYDTGLKSISVVGTRTNSTTFSLGPLTYYVKSPLRQDSIFQPFGKAINLSTALLTDNDVYYFWSFGPAVGDTIKSPFSQYSVNSMPPNIITGKKGIGSLWVTDTGEKIRSTASSFSFEFFRPIQPVIKCTTKGLFNRDSIASGDTLIFTIQIIDSSGVGMKDVSVNGKSMSSSDNLNYSMIFTGIKTNSYTKAHPKVLTVLATNNANESATDSFFCFYDSSGVKPALIKLTLINPTSSVTTKLDTVLFILKVNKYSADTAAIKIQAGPAVFNLQSVDSVKTFYRDIALSQGPNTITAAAYIHGQLYADTSVTVTKNANVVDATPPQILTFKVNNKTYAPVQNAYTVTIGKSDSTVNVSVIAIDNESGIASVSIAENNVTPIKSYNLSYDKNTFSWITTFSPPASFIKGTLKQLTCSLTINNGSGLSVQKTVYVFKN